MIVTASYALCFALVGLLIVKARAWEQTLTPLNTDTCAYRELEPGFRALSVFLKEMDIPLSARYRAKPVVREGTEPYANTEELLGWLVKQANPRDLVQFKALVQGFYQLQLAWDLPFDAIERCLSIVVDDLRQQETVETYFVESGQPVDLKTMHPLNPGSTVAQPLGVVVFSEGNVLSKARVLCR